MFSCKKDQSEELTPGIHNKTIQIDGVDREYAIYIPSGGIEESQTYPIVFLVHGHGGSMQVMSGQNATNSAFHAWKPVADENNLILCYPNGTEGSDNTSGWNDCRGDATKLTELDDSKFLSELIDLSVSDYQADPNRVYFCGVSNGGFMSMRMAIEHPAKIAAFAVINSQMAAESECGQPTTPLPILIMNGTSDAIVPYDGGSIGPTSGVTLSTDSTIQLWVNLNGTNTTADIFHFPDINTSDGSTVTKSSYLHPTSGNDVIVYDMVGAGHTEASIAHQYSALYESLVGMQNHDIEMANEIWSFFEGRSK